MNWYRKFIIAGGFGKITPRDFYNYFIRPKFQNLNHGYTQPDYEDFYEILEEDKHSLAMFIQVANSGPTPDKVDYKLANQLAQRIESKLVFNSKFNPPAGSPQDYRLNKIINEEISPVIKADPKMFRRVIKTDAVLMNLYVKFVSNLIKKNKSDKSLLLKMKDHWNALPTEVTQPKPVYELSQEQIFNTFIKPQGDPFDKISLSAFVKMIKNGSQPLIDAYKEFATSVKKLTNKQGIVYRIRSNGKSLHKLLNRVRKYLDAMNSNKPKPLANPNQGSGRGGGWNKFSGSEVIISDVLTMTIGKNNFVFQVDHKLWNNNGLYDSAPVVDFLIEGKYHFELFGGPGMNSDKPVSPGSNVTLQMIYDLKKQEKQKNIQNLFWLDNRADNLLKTYSLIKYAQALESHVDTNSTANGQKVQLFKGLYAKLVEFKPLLSQFGIQLSEHYVYAVMNASKQKKKLFEQQADQFRQNLDQQGFKVDIGKAPIGPKHPVNTELKNPYPMNQTQPLVPQLPKGLHDLGPKKSQTYNMNQYRQNVQPQGGQQFTGEPPTLEEIDAALAQQEYHSASMWPPAERVAVYFGTKEAIMPYLDMLGVNNQENNQQNPMKIGPQTQVPQQQAPMSAAASSEWKWNLLK